MLSGSHTADSQYVQEGAVLRTHVARSLERQAADIVKDAAALFPFSGVKGATPDWHTRLGELILQALAATARDGGVEAASSGAIALREAAEERQLAIPQVFSLVYVMERAALDALALDDSFDAACDWPALIQIVRRASFDLLAAFVDSGQGLPRPDPVVDPLTTVHTRPVLVAATEKEVHRHERFGHPFALMLVDVDLLSEINERDGYGSGNRVLERLGILMRNYFREQDWVGRYSGGAFAVLLPETHREHAIHLAERVRTTIANRIALHDYRSDEEFPLSVSVGVVYVQSVDRSVRAEQLWEEAQHAVRRAKLAGRNRIEAVDVSIARSASS